MFTLSDYIAFEINGEAVSLADVLRLAKMSGQLQFIEDAINNALIQREAAELDISATDSELQQAADDFRAAHDLHTAEATENWLAERHLTFEDWEALIEHKMIGQKLREAVTDGKVEQHFVENSLSFDCAAISRIVVGDEDIIRELRAQIFEEGADFHALARQYSTDTATKHIGGYAGQISRTEMEAAVESAVFGAQPGKIVGPLKTDDGWQLIKVESIHKATLNEALRETIKSQLFDEWLNDHRRKARISTPLLEEDGHLECEVESESMAVDE